MQEKDRRGNYGRGKKNLEFEKTTQGATIKNIKEEDENQAAIKTHPLKKKQESMFLQDCRSRGLQLSLTLKRRIPL